MAEKEVILNFKIGIIKELFACGLITEYQKDKCIQLFKDEYLKGL